MNYKLMNQIISKLMSPEPPPSAWSRPYDVTLLRQRLALLPEDDPLQPLLLGLLDASVVEHTNTKVSADLAAHQFVGRLNMIGDLRADLVKLWRDSHPPKR